MLSNDLVDWHCIHLDQGYAAFHENDFHTALVEFDMALAIDDRPMARWDRALTLLAMGRYAEGFREWRTNWQIYRAEITERGQRLYFDEHRPVWKGEPGRVLVLGEAGFGDQVQMLRFVSPSMVLDMPKPMQRLAAQVAPLAESDDCDFVCPMFDIPAVLRVTPETIPSPPYLKPDPALILEWANRIGNGGRRRIGIAWSTKFEETYEHPNARRAVPLDQFLSLLNAPPDSELYSLQTQEAGFAITRGVRVFEFADFADVAALASLMDVVVAIDSAQLHVAGAIGHPLVFGLLPYSPTWRWLDPCWYPELKQCRCDAPGDWASAFAKVKNGQRANQNL